MQLAEELVATLNEPIDEVRLIGEHGQVCEDEGVHRPDLVGDGIDTLVRGMVESFGRHSRGLGQRQVYPGEMK